MLFLKAFISVLIITASSLNLSLNKFKKREYILWVIGIAFLSSIVAIFSEMIAGIVSIILIVCMLYRISKKLFISIFYTIISMVLSVLSDNIIFAIIKNGLKNGEAIKANLESDMVLYIIVSFFVFLLVFSLSKILGQILHKKHIAELVSSNNRVGFVLSLFMIITFIFIYASVFLDYDKNPLIIIGLYSLYIIFVLMAVLILVAMLKKENALTTKNMELEQLRRYTENVEILYNNMRKARHDYMNILSSLIGYIDARDMKGLEVYFDNEIIPFSKKLQENDSKLGLLSYVKTLEIKGVLAIKTINALEKGVKVNLEIKEDIIFSNIDILDLCRVLGILLDNAFEAAVECANPMIGIALINNENSVTIVVTNNTIEKTIPIYKIEEQGYSTKGEKRGLGLSNLREIINSYSNISIDTIFEESEFQQILEIASND